MTRVTLDWNEYVSAFHFGGKSLDLIRSAIAGEIEIAISEPILSETIRVLREKFEWNPYRLHELRERLLKTCKLVEPKQALAVVADEPDNRILECAQEAGSAFIITEDKALLRVKEHGSTKVTTVRQFLSGGGVRD